MSQDAAVRLLDTDAIGDALLADLLPWLNAAEAQRYAGFVRRARQRQFLIGRVLLRQMLGDLLGIPARSVVLEERPGQAPLAAHAGLSISHSGRWVACAVSAGSALGLDIEVIDPARDIAALAEQAFSEAQCAWLAARAPASRVRDFYLLWSAQEARIKLGAQAAHCAELAHPELSIVLCSAVAPERPVQLSLAPLFGAPAYS